MTERVVVLGAGGHAKMCLEVLRAQGRFEPLGILDPDPPQPSVLGCPVIGADDMLPILRRDGIGLCFLALGGNALRARKITLVRQLGFRIATIIHPSAVILASAWIGDGVAVMPRAVVGAEARVEAAAIINTGAVIEHDCIVGTAAHIAPGVTLAGAVHVGARALIGVGSSVRPSVTVGEDAVVGVGAAVVADVAPGCVVGGVPARHLRVRGKGAH